MSRRAAGGRRFLQAQAAPLARPVRGDAGAAFQRLLPELARRCPGGGWALLHRGELVGLYVSEGKARRAGEGRFRYLGAFLRGQGGAGGRGKRPGP